MIKILKSLNIDRRRERSFWVTHTHARTHARTHANTQTHTHTHTQNWSEKEKLVPKHLVPKGNIFGQISHFPFSKEH